MTFVDASLARFRDPVTMGEVALEMRARWHRAYEEYRNATHGMSTEFVKGRLTGISTDLALMLGAEHKHVHKMLMDEHDAFMRHPG